MLAANQSHFFRTGTCLQAEAISSRLAAPTVEVLPFPDRYGLGIKSDLKLLHALHRCRFAKCSHGARQCKKQRGKQNKHILHSPEPCL